jgi:hypothetical protein
MNTTPTLSQLQRGLAISEQIAALQAELSAIFNGSAPAPAVKAAPTATAPAAQGDGRTGKRSAATIAKMKASQQARWAKAKAEAPAAAPKKKGGMSPAHKAKLKAAAKKRWAAIRAGKAPNPFAAKG